MGMNAFVPFTEFSLKMHLVNCDVIRIPKDRTDGILDGVTCVFGGLESAVMKALDNIGYHVGASLNRPSIHSE